MSAGLAQDPWGSSACIPHTGSVCKLSVDLNDDRSVFVVFCILMLYGL